MISFYDMQEQVFELADEYVSNMEQVNGSDLGLDIRAGYTLFVNVGDGVIACPVQFKSMLDYYGGFEYVDSHFVSTMGGYVFYTGGARVQECLDYFIDEKEEV